MLYYAVTASPESICHDTVPTAERGTTRTAGGIMGQAKIMTHLMGDGGGKANGVAMVILGLKAKNYYLE